MPECPVGNVSASIRSRDILTYRSTMYYYKQLTQGIICDWN